MCCFTTAHVSLEYNSTDMTMHWKNCILVCCAYKQLQSMMAGCGSLAQDQANDRIQPVYVVCASTDQEAEGCCEGVPVVV